MIGSHLADWLHLGLRWLHVVAGVVWIGTSFYFVWLNNHVRPSAEQLAGSEAELWAVHGGAFYRVTKYSRPDRLPGTLHWFKWEAYTTWLSGFSLLILLFYITAPVLLIDTNKADLSALAAAGIGIATLVIGWMIYEGMSRSRLLESPVWFATVSLVLVSGLAIALSRVFTERGAYIHVGAVLGTLMAGNVFFVIIPGQKEMVAAMEEGREPDTAKGRHASLRSLHNNYMTLPVLFIMISSHFPFTYGYDQGWVILIGLIVAGAGIRHWFNMRGKGERNVWIVPAAALMMLALAFVSLPSDDLPDIDPSTVTFEDGVNIMYQRCTPCHSASPTQAGYLQPPKGVTFDSASEMVSRSAMIRAMAVDTRTMPLGNVTGMTDEERAVLRVWLDDHATG